jgi:UDP-N-acetylmuramyl tripeptide synthase
MEILRCEKLIGESYCSTPRSTVLNMLNTPIKYLNMVNFTDNIRNTYPTLPQLTICNYNKNNARLFGKYRHNTKEVIINRSCEWVFLHELAHAIQYCCYTDHGHTSLFARILDQLDSKWINWLHTEGE